jgi:hypothetical protein
MICSLSHGGRRASVSSSVPRLGYHCLTISLTNSPLYYTALFPLLIIARAAHIFEFDLIDFFLSLSGIIS